MSAGRLVLEDLRKRFPDSDRPTLDGVDLEADAGTILVLLGTSGAGKTTLLRVVAGLETADSGRILVGDRVLSGPGIQVAPQLRDVGLVFQHLELWPHMTVAENIAFGLPGRPRGRAAAANAVVRDLAERVGVQELLRRSPGTLSGGERQRVAIARTVAPDPAVVLYDEPLANLDPERRKDLRRLIRSLCRDRASTLVYVTHDATEAMELGDEIAVLHRGRIADRGDPMRLYRLPRSVAVARALGPVNVVPGTASGDGVDTALGHLAVASPAVDGRVQVLVRPEQVEATGGEAGEIVGVTPAAGRWRFTARIDGTTDDSEVVEGTSGEQPHVGRRVGLRVTGPVAVIASPAGEEER